MEKKLKNSVNYLLELPLDDLKMFRGKFPYLHEEDIIDSADEAYNWCLARGRKFKNYRAFFTNWLRKNNRWAKEKYDQMSPNQKLVRRLWGK
jgi:hypothetical protein